MSQPSPWSSQQNYTVYAAQHPAAPFIPSSLDLDFANLAVTVSQTLANLKLIQRDDGQLANGIVTVNSLATDTKNLIGGWNPRGVWTPITNYAVRDMVTPAGGTVTYVCAVAHTSSALFSTDLATGKWQIVNGTGVVIPDSVALTGIPTAPTAPFGTNTTQIANTAFVQAAVVGAVTGVASFNSRVGAVTLNAADVANALTFTPLGPNLTGPITSSGNATALAAKTGNGTTFVVSDAPTISGTASFSGGIVNVYDTTQSRFGGLVSQSSAAVLGFGVNDSSSNIFGGAYTQADQGGLLKIDTRAGNSLFSLVGRAAAATTGVAVFTVESAGGVSLRSSGATSGNWHTYKRADGVALFQTINKNNGGSAIGDFVLQSDGGSGMRDTMIVSRGANEVICNPSYANVKLYGADPTGATDCTTAVSNAIAAGYTVLYFPKGTYKFTSQLTFTNQNIAFVGDGPQISRLIWFGAVNGIGFAGLLNNSTCHHIIMHGIGFVAGDANVLAAITASWTSTLNAFPSTVHSAIIENCEFVINDGSSRWHTGISLTNAATPLIRDCYFSQLNFATGIRDATGIIFTSSGSPAIIPDELYVRGCQFSNLALGLSVAGLTQGVRVTDSTFVGCLTGLKCDGSGQPGGFDYLNVIGCEFAVYRVGIDAISTFHLNCRGNYFLALPKESVVTWNGVKISRTNTTNDFQEDSIIADNFFHLLDNTYTAMYPVNIDGFSGTRTAKHIDIRGNHFGGLAWTKGALLGVNTTKILYHGTNLGDNAEVASDLGTANVIQAPLV